MHSKTKVGSRLALAFFLIALIIAGDLFVHRWMSDPQTGGSRQDASTAFDPLESDPNSWGHSTPRLVEVPDHERVELIAPASGDSVVQYFPPIESTATAVNSDAPGLLTTQPPGTFSMEVEESSGVAVATDRDFWPPAPGPVITTNASDDGGPNIQLGSPIVQVPQAVEISVPPIELPVTEPAVEDEGISNTRNPTQTEAELEGVAQVPQVSPEPIQAPGDAGSLMDENRRRAVTSIIRQELPDATDEEVEIWVRELGGLPGGAIRDLLGMRRQLAYEDSFLPKSRLTPLPSDVDVEVETLPPRPIDNPYNVAPRSVPAESFAVPQQVESWHGSAESQVAGVYRSMQNVVAHNLANVETTGFKRLNVRTAPRGPISLETVRAPMLVVDIDMSQGKMEATGNTWDLAIDGDGFFVVSDGRENFYTRCGHFVLNEQGQLELSTDRGPLILQLAGGQAIDVASSAITVTRQGQIIAAGTSPTEANVVASIQLAVFRNPSRLTPQGLCFEANNDSGSATLKAAASAGVGRLLQGSVERSNVDLTAELAKSERLRRAEALVSPQPGGPLGIASPSSVFLDDPAEAMPTY